jgi:hypothetical protein
MAINAQADYGLDIACWDDADELFTEAVGLAVVKQDAYHRLTTENVLGPQGTDWGYDCRTLLGAPSEHVKVMGPILTEVLTRDDRVLTADVTIDVTPNPTGLDLVTISVLCQTAQGPFEFTVSVNAFSEETLSNQR